MSFFSRHRRKILFSGGFVVTAIGCYYSAKFAFKTGLKKVEEIGKELEKSAIRQRLKQEQFEKINDVAHEALSKFSSSLLVYIKKYTHTKSFTQNLKSLRAKKKTLKNDREIETLWNELKIISITRIIFLFNYLSLLNTLLKIQVHILARESFDLDNDENIPRKTREVLFLKTASAIIENEEDISYCVEAVKNLVNKETKDWKMGTEQTFTFDDLVSRIKNIQQKLQENKILDKVLHGVVETLEKDDEIQSLSKAIVNEALDIYDSPLTLELGKDGVDKLLTAFTKALSEGKMSTLTSEPKQIITKVLVKLLKQIILFVDNKDVLVCLKNSELQHFVYQDIYAGTDNMEAQNLGLSSLGLSNEDIKSFQGLLSGDETEMMKILQTIGSQENLLQK